MKWLWSFFLEEHPEWERREVRQRALAVIAMSLPLAVAILAGLVYTIMGGE